MNKISKHKSKTPQLLFVQKQIEPEKTNSGRWKAKSSLVYTVFYVFSAQEWKPESSSTPSAVYTKINSTELYKSVVPSLSKVFHTVIRVCSLEHYFQTIIIFKSVVETSFRVLNKRVLWLSGSVGKTKNLVFSCSSLTVHSFISLPTGTV